MFKTLKQFRRFTTAIETNQSSNFINPIQMLNKQKFPEFSRQNKIIDVRSPENYKTHHIKNALNIHDMFTYLQETSCIDGTKKMQNYFIDILSKNGITGDSNENLIVYEQGLNKLFGVSCRSYFILKYLGHPSVQVLSGGIDAYIASAEANNFDLSELLTADETEITPAKYNGVINSEWMCDYNEMLNSIHDDNVTILDVRDKDEWFGTSSSPYGVDFCPRKGRIPNSKWIEWYDFMEPNNDCPVGTMKHKSKNDIEKMLKDIGVTNKDRKILIYCFKGSRASNSLMAIKNAGYKNVKNYFASFNEWSRNHTLPIDSNIITQHT